MSADGSPTTGRHTRAGDRGSTARSGSTGGSGSTGADAGVIHDIGYRHYSGPRLGRSHILRSLYLDGFRGAFGLGRSAKSKVMPMVLLASMSIPALVIVVLVSVTNATELPIAYTSYALNLQLAVAIFVAAAAPTAVSRDLRYRTISLYFSRPLERGDYVLARFAAMASAVFTLIAIPLTVLLAGALLAKLPLADQLRGYLTGLAGAALFAVVLTGIALLIASVTPRRGFGVAAVITVLLILTAVGGALQAIADEQGHPTAAGYLGAINPFTLVDGVQVWAFDASPSSPAGPPGATGGLVFAALTVVVVLGSYALLLLRYRKVSVS
jgi:ABC-2 type transport system permease protein